MLPHSVRAASPSQKIATVSEWQLTLLLFATAAVILVIIAVRGFDVAIPLVAAPVGVVCEPAD